MMSAFPNSVNWYYQEVASRVGKDKMQNYLNLIKYGNTNISGGITKFWLQSTLRISPIEQILLLKNIYTYQMPFSHKNIDVIKKLMILSQDSGIVLSGKSGSVDKNGKGINGLFVGYIERDSNVYFFSISIEGDGANGSIAQNIAINILKNRKIL